MKHAVTPSRDPDGWVAAFNAAVEPVDEAPMQNFAFQFFEQKILINGLIIAQLPPPPKIPRY